MPFGNLGTIWSEMGLDIRKLDAGLMKAQLKLAGADKTITSWGQKLTNQSTKLITVGGLMAAAVAGIGIATTKMAADFEKSMRNVNSISRLSEQQFKKQADEVLTLSTRMPQSAKVLADGLYDIASSGFAGADGMKVLEASAKAASAGLTETATSAKGITAVLNAYALSADMSGKVSDTMFRTVDKGVITFEELSNTVGDFVGMGKIANLSFDELSGALGYITTKGVDAASAGVSLNRVILAIIDPSNEMAEALKRAGYESGEAALHELGLVGIMEMLSKSTGGSLTELQKLFPEMRALRGASALLSSGIDDLNTYMLDFNDTTGATNIALKEQEKSLSFQMELLKNNASAVAIALGTELIPSVTKYVVKLSEWINKNQELAGNIVKITGGIVGFGGMLLLLAGIVGKVRLAVIALNTATHGWATILIPLAIAATYLGKKAYDAYRWSITEAEDKIYDLVTAEKALYDARKHANEMTADVTDIIDTKEVDAQVEAIKLDEKRAESIKNMVRLYPELESKVISLAVAYQKAIDEQKGGGWSETTEEFNEQKVAVDRAREAYQKFGDQMVELEEQSKTDKIESHAEAIIRSTEIIEKYSKVFPEAASEIDKLNDQLEAGLITEEKYDEAIEEIRKNIVDYILVTKILNGEIKDNWIYTDDLSNKQKELADKLGITEEQLKELGIVTDDTTGSMDEQEQAAKELEEAIGNLSDALSSGAISPAEYIEMLSNLGVTLNQVEDGFNAIIEAAFRFYNNQYALEESTKEYEEELEKLDKMQGTYSKTVGGTEQDILNNINAQENLTKAQENYNKILSETPDDQKAVLEAHVALTNAQNEANEAAKNAVPVTKTYTASQEELAEQVKKVTDEYIEMLNWGMAVYNQNQKDIELGKLTSAQKAEAIEQNKELQKSFVESGLKAVELETTSLESFTAMATGFGLSADDISKIAAIMSSDLDEATKARKIDAVINAHFYETMMEIQTRLSEIKDKVVNVDINYNKRYFTYGSEFGESKAMGGIVKAYAGGGVIGSDGAYQPIMAAASGMVVPQTGRAVPIIAHEYEDIINTSQQRNLAEWIMGKANSRPDYAGSNVPIEIRIPIELDGRIIGEKVAKFIYDGSQTKLKLGG